MRGNARRRTVCAAIAVLATMVGPVVSSAVSSAPGAGAATVAAPYVSGNTLYYGDSGDGVLRRYVLKGAAVHFVEQYADATMQKYTLADWNNRDAILLKMRALGMNTIRIPLTYAAYDASQIRSQTAWIDRLQSIVNAADAYDMNVIFSWWDGDTDAANWPSNYQKLFPMLTALFSRIGNHPRVMYEPWNEPNHVTWDQWLTPTQQTIAKLRSLGYTGVIIVDTINWSWSFDPNKAQTILDFDAGVPPAPGPRRAPNILFSNHRYANTSTCFCDADPGKSEWQNEIGSQVGAFPIAGLEYGYFNNPYGPTPLWNQQFLQYVADTAVPAGFNGAMAFVWDWVDQNTMVSPDGERTNLTQWGGIYNDSFLARVAGVGNPLPTGRAALAGVDVADADVNSNKTKVNDGAGTLLWIDSRRDSYVKFSVTGVNGRRVVRAAIRFYVSSGTNRSAAKFHRVPNTTWQENAITWSNAPPPDPAVLDTITSLVFAQSYTIEVTPQIAGDGLYSFKFDGGTSDSAAFASRETANPPQLYLVVE